MIFLNLSIIKPFNRFLGNIPLIRFNSFILLERYRNFNASTCFSVFYSKAFPKGEYLKLACSSICLCLESNNIS